MTEREPLSIGMCAQLACVLEVAANKPGNVGIAARHSDMSYFDFYLSARAIAPIMEQAPQRSIGQTILESIRATRSVTSANTNLGIILLLAPLASVPSSDDFKGGLSHVLAQLTVDDAHAAYEAIRLAKPGGLGSVDQQDVAEEPTVTLLEAMALAADRDMIARQYVNEFEQVFEGAELLRAEMNASDLNWKQSVTRTYLKLLSQYPDSLILRQFGSELAQRVSQRAKSIVQLGFNDLAIFDFAAWFRIGCPNCDEASNFEEYELIAPPKRPNPGTTADLIAASLFVALRSGMIRVPLDTLLNTDL